MGGRGVGEAAENGGIEQLASLECDGRGGGVDGKAEKGGGADGGKKDDGRATSERGHVGETGGAGRLGSQDDKRAGAAQQHRRAAP